MSGNTELTASTAITRAFVDVEVEINAKIGRYAIHGITSDRIDGDDVDHETLAAVVTDVIDVVDELDDSEDPTDPGDI